MKIFLLAIMFLLTMLKGFSQDIIIKNSGDTIRCLITKIEEEKISFDIKRKENTISSFISRSEIKDYRLNVESLKNEASGQLDKNEICTNATERHAALISWSGGFSDQTNSSYSVNSINLALNYNSFVSKNIFLGLSTALLYSWNKSSSQSTITIGPQFGITFNKNNSTVIPLFVIGINYARMNGGVSYYGYNYDIGYNGINIHLGTGLIIPVKEHLGLTIELADNFLAYNNTSVNLVLATIGMIVMLY
jgi:hypothetical protein